MAKRLLIVEDDLVYADLLQRALGRSGFECEAVTTTADALARAEAWQPQALLLDLKLATETSLPAIAPLRALLPDARIILLTGYASIATAVEAIKLGADDYLPKPVEITAIVAALAGQAMLATVEQALSPRRLEWEHIQRVLAEQEGNVSAAARALGMHRRSLQRKLAKKPAGR